jgi:hypothetical protein
VSLIQGRSSIISGVGHRCCTEQGRSAQLGGMWASIHCGALKSTIGEMALNSMRTEADSGNTADYVAVFIFPGTFLSSGPCLVWVKGRQSR